MLKLKCITEDLSTEDEIDYFCLHQNSNQPSRRIAAQAIVDAREVSNQLKENILNSYASSPFQERSQWDVELMQLFVVYCYQQGYDRSIVANFLHAHGEQRENPVTSVISRINYYPGRSSTKKASLSRVIANCIVSGIVLLGYFAAIIILAVTYSAKSIISSATVINSNREQDLASSGGGDEFAAQMSGNGNAMAMLWLIIVFVSWLHDALILQPLQVSFRWLVYDDSLCHGCLDLLSTLRKRFLSIVHRKIDCLRVSDAAIQHLNPVCRTAVLVERSEVEDEAYGELSRMSVVPASASLIPYFLIGINDNDLGQTMVKSSLALRHNYFFFLQLLSLDIAVLVIANAIIVGLFCLGKVYLPLSFVLVFLILAAVVLAFLVFIGYFLPPEGSDASQEPNLNSGVQQNSSMFGRSGVDYMDGIRNDFEFADVYENDSNKSNLSKQADDNHSGESKEGQGKIRTPRRSPYEPLSPLPALSTPDDVDSSYDFDNSNNISSPDWNEDLNNSGGSSPPSRNSRSSSSRRGTLIQSHLPTKTAHNKRNAMSSIIHSSSWNRQTHLHFRSSNNITLHTPKEGNFKFDAEEESL